MSTLSPSAEPESAVSGSDLVEEMRAATDRIRSGLGGLVSDGDVPSPDDLA